MGLRSLGGYIALVGFIILVIGIYVSWTSTTATPTASFDSPNSALAGSSMTLLAGVLVALVGGMFLLVGLFSTMRRPRTYL